VIFEFLYSQYPLTHSETALYRGYDIISYDG